jgi:GTP-binding protein Era
MSPAKKAKKSEVRAGRIAIVGRPNVGKSTLLNALLGETIAITSKHPQTTRDQILGVVTHPDAQFVFVDTPGVHRARHKLGTRMNTLARDAARDADVVVFMTDVAPEPRTTMSEEDRAILAALPKLPTILVLNKVDRIKQKAHLFPVLEGHAKEHDFAAIVPMSALREGAPPEREQRVRPAEGMKRLLAEIRERLPEQEKLYDDETLSDKPVRFFVAEFVREQILRKTFQEVPHGVAVIVERFEEPSAKAKNPVTRIDLAIHVDREAHKSILIGSRGSMLRAIGTDARARVEKMLGTHVHMQLWVRVTPKWFESDARLKELGYAGDGPLSGDDA